MLHRPSLALLLTAAAIAGCGGGSDDDEPAATAPQRAETPAAQACPPQTDQILEDAAFRISNDDFDGAFEVMGEVEDCPRVQAKLVAYKARAAKKTLQIAKDQLVKAKRRGGNNASPQPAVSLARNSIRYKDTPEARAFLALAQDELAKFNEKYGPKPTTQGGGPPAQAQP